jgi:hypothetical protein
MHKSATKCNETIGKWCKSKHGASKIYNIYKVHPHLDAFNVCKLKFGAATSPQLPLSIGFQRCGCNLSLCLSHALPAVSARKYKMCSLQRYFRARSRHAHLFAGPTHIDACRSSSPLGWSARHTILPHQSLAYISASHRKLPDASHWKPSQPLHLLPFLLLPLLDDITTGVLTSPTMCSDNFNGSRQLTVSIDRVFFLKESPGGERIPTWISFLSIGLHITRWEVIAP